MRNHFTFSEKGIAGHCGIQVSWCLAAAQNQDEELELIQPEDMQSFSVDIRENICAVWQGHPLLGEDFKVTVIWQNAGNGLLSGCLSWSGNSSQLAIEEIRFPAISSNEPEDSRFLIPSNLGELVTMRHAAARGRRSFYASMQWTALFPAGKDHGFYLDCRDPEHLLKQFDYGYKEGVFTHTPVYYVPLAPENHAAHTMPYSCTFGRFDGSWFEGAQIYRSWALEQSWYTDRLPEQEKLRRISMWVWNRGTAEEVIPPAERLQQDAGVPVALDWYWWHSNPYDTDYPEFWPPRAGEEAFREAIARLNSQDIFVQVYTNGMTWDIDAPSYENDHGIGSLQVNRDGTPTAMMFNPYTRHRLAIMCGEAEEYHQKMIALSGKIASCGLPGLYLDMIGSYALAPCCNALHKHVKGGGSYQKDGYYRYVTAIRKNHPDLLLSTEYASEMMDLFESVIMLDSSIERCYGSAEMEAVPAYMAVYHGDGVTVFGSYAIPDGIPAWDPEWPDKDRWQVEEDWHRQFEHQFFIELARCIIWGVQPCICNLKTAHAEDPEFAVEYKYILDTAKFYHENTGVLHSGRMLSPEGFECENIRVKFMKRGIFTLRADMTVLEREQPAVLHSFWLAPDGRKALVMANYTRQERAAKYRDGSGNWHSVMIKPLSFELKFTD